MSGVGLLAPEELHSWREGGKAFTLLDVRTPPECDAASLVPAMHIPMNEIPARIEEIPRNLPLVVICHHGERSAHVAAFLAARGFSPIYNVDGGIDAYASRVDPSVARY